MKYIFLLLFFPVLQCFSQSDASKNPYNLPIINTIASYKSSCANNPDLELIDLKKVIPSLVLDIKYATKDNFMKQVMYKQARAFARKPVAQQLQKIQQALRKKGYGLKIYDAYRPYTVTLAFYEKASNKSFVADPKKGSKHNRGCAIDLTLVYLKNGKELPMPTPYDSFAPEAAAKYPNLPPEIIKNRDFLISTMSQHNFRVIKNEWWHFDFIGWENHPLMDISFESL